MDTAAAQHSKLGEFFPMVFDLFAPIVVYYGLHLVGASDFVALTLGGFVSGINAVVDMIRNRQTKSISGLVLVLFILSIALVLATQDARIILLKPSLFIGAAGLYVMSTAFRRPILLDGMEPFATEGDPVKREKWNHAWQDSDAFRHRLQTATLLSGLLMLVEAAARAVIVFVLPVAQSVIVSNIPGVLMIVFFALIGRFYLKGAAEQAMALEDTKARSE